MSLFSSLEEWLVLDGHLSPVVHNVNAWSQSNVAVSSLFDDNVTYHSQPAENLLDFNGMLYKFIPFKVEEIIDLYSAFTP